MMDASSTNQAKAATGVPNRLKTAARVSFVLVFFSLCFGILHRPALVGAIAPGDGGQGRAVGESLALAEATLLALGPSLLLALLRRRPRTAAAMLSVIGAVLALGLYIDARALLFFASRAVFWDLATTRGGALGHGGVESGVLLRAALATLGLGTAVYALIRLLLSGRRLPGASLWLCVAAILSAHCAVVTGWTLLPDGPVRTRPALAARALLGSYGSATSVDSDPTGALGRATRYPLRPYHAANLVAQPDILLIVAESLRASAFNPQVMPTLSADAAQGMVAQQHFSNANCTAPGLFSLLYGTNPIPYPLVRKQHIASAPLAWLKAKGYRLELFSGTAVTWAGMNESFFSNFDAVYAPQEANYVLAHDVEAVDRCAERFVEPTGQPRFFVLFLNATHHGYYYPAEFERFRPSAPPLQLELGLIGDVRPMLNRYYNAVAFMDSLVHKVVSLVQSRGRSRPIVVFTGDHGEEFLEHGAMVHASNLFDPQVRVPLVTWNLPGFPAGLVLRQPSAHEQLLPTILAAIAPDLDTSAAGTGRPLGDPNAPPFLVAQCSNPSELRAVDQAESTFVTAAAHTISWNEIHPADRGPIRIGLLPNNADAILAALTYFGGGPYDTQKWPCPKLAAPGATFYVCPTGSTWAAAHSFCQQHGTELAWFDDLEQFAAVLKGAPAKELWIGMSDAAAEGVFRWSSGQPTAFTHWAQREPNGGRAENCVMLHDDGQRAWDDRSCAIARPFLCRGP